MKKIILTVAMFIAMAGISHAQSPEEFSYQAVARDVSGNVLPNQSVGVEISILENSSSGTVIYTETHSATTNSFGLLNFNIGTGTVVSGTFSSIDWGNDTHFVQISMDLTGGTSYNLMGTSQLVSVPYALHAKTASSVTNDMVDDADANPTNEIQDISLTGTDLAITSGSTVDLSVLQDGVDDADASITNEIQDISLTGTNLAITSGSTVDLSVLQDGVDDADASITNEIQDISLTGTNLAITSGSTVDLSVLQDGVNDADASITNEIQDISLTGTNLAITSGSTIDLSVLQDGVNDADASVTNEIQSLTLTGSSLSISGGNTVTLPASGGGVWTTVSADYNQIDFTGSSDAQIKGNGSTDLSGSDFALGNGVFWGSNPGEDTGMFTDGDQLILMSPADNQLVQFWEEDGHQVVAQISSAGAYSQVSDETLKQNIQVIDNALEKTLDLAGYTYEFKQNAEDIKKGTPVELGMGILAQELKKVAPRLVTKTDQGHFVVNYDGIIPILIEATKEQQDLISGQQAEIDELKAELEAIKQLLLKK